MVNTNRGIPPAPCFHNSCFNKVFETNWVVRNFGRIGFEACAKYRRSMTIVAATFTFISMLLLIPPALGLSVNYKVVEHVSWTHGKSTTFVNCTITDTSHTNTTTQHIDVFVGLSEIAFRYRYDRESGSDCTNKIKRVEWRDAHQCTTTYCQSCKSATHQAWSMAAFSAIFCIAQLVGDLHRAYEHTDLNIVKFLGVMAGTLGLLTTLYALNIYASKCHDNLTANSSFDGVTVNNTTWRYGPGVYCIAFATVTKSVDIIVHLLIPTSPDHHSNDYEGPFSLPSYSKGESTDELNMQGPRPIAVPSEDL